MEWQNICHGFQIRYFNATFNNQLKINLIALITSISISMKKTI